MRKYIHLFLAILVVIPILILSVFVAIIPIALLRLFGKRQSAEQWAQLNGTFIARTIMWVVNVKMTTFGTENIPQDGSPVCFVANHQSMLDIPAVVSGLKIWGGFIAKKELKKVPILNFWIESIHCVYIDRKSPRSSIEAIFKGVENIKQGIPMFIFPEGTRSKDGQLGQFKNGSLKLATRSQALIVPVAIHGTRQALEAKRGIRRVEVKMAVSEPIVTKGLSADELKALPNRVFGELEQAYNALQKM